ncbi:agenet domain-containing family protein [Salix suchowensis]|nr:agenet domain-containing family protein [Salix suchowensis]
MERLGIRSPAETALVGYVSWEEVNVSRDKGRREVKYYLKKNDGGKDLAIIGKEMSLRHMSYNYAISIWSNLYSMTPPVKLKSRREVIDWLNSIVSGSFPHELSIQAGSLDISDASRLDMETLKSQKLGHYYPKFLWLGSPWTCKKRRNHYESFCKDDVKISVHDFVYVLAEEDKRLVAYLEDLYEDSKGNKMVMVRWFHKIDEVDIVLPHNFNDREIFFSLCLQDLSIECIDGLAIILSPQHFKKFQNEWCILGSIPLFATSIEGYWSQEILRYLTIPPSNYPANFQHPFSGSRGEGNDHDANRMRPKKVLCRSKDNDGACTGRKELLTARYINVQSFHTSRVNGKTGYEMGSQRGKEHTAFLSTAEITQNPSQSLNVGSEVEVLSQDSGIKGCWFRASIIKKHKDKVKVRYRDISDAANEPQKLEEWVLVSRVAAPDQLAIRISGRNVVRPTPQFNKGQVASNADVGTAVDAWWNNAWWEGIVVQKETEDRIHVFFPGEKTESVFCCSDLRLSIEWLGNGWTHIKERPDILSQLPSCSERKQVTFISDESKLAQVAIPGSRQSGKTNPGCGYYPLESRLDMRKKLKMLPDLSKDILLGQLRWSSIKKRRRGSGSSGHKMHHSNNGGLRLAEVVGSNAGERFLIPTSLKVDHEICKHMGDSLCTYAAVQPLTSLVMSR